MDANDIIERRASRFERRLELLVDDELGLELDRCAFPQMAVRHAPICSRTIGFRMMMARRAHKEMDPMMATGIARISGQGVAMTSTARNRVALPVTVRAP